MQTPSLSPRAVPPDAPRRWIHQAAALTWRAPALSLAVAVLAALWIGAIERLGPLVGVLFWVALYPVTVTVAVRGMAALDARPRMPLADLGRQLIEQPSVTLRASLAAMGPLILSVALPATAGLALGSTAPPTGAHLVWWTFGTLILCVTGFGTFIVRAALRLALCALADQSWPEALRVSEAAVQTNRAAADRVGTALGVWVWVLLLPFPVVRLAAGIVAAPWLGALAFVMYRDLFLGRAENAPQAVPAAAGARAPAPGKA